MMLAIYSAGREVDAPLFFCPATTAKALCLFMGNANLVCGCQGGKILIICAGSGRLQRGLLSRVYSISSYKNSADDVLY
jgi:hypothetical protein